MENKCKFIVMLLLAAVFLFYRVDSVVAMETEQNIVSTTESETETEQIAEAEAEQQPGETAESEEELEQPPEETAWPEVKPEADPEETQELEAEPEQQPEETAESEAEPEETAESEVEPGQQPEENAELETESGQQPEEIAELEAEPFMEFSAMPEQETVSDGEALVAWLEAHKNTGGTVKLEDDLVLDGEYSFYPNGINSPDILVDTDQYTITVTGEISFLSNGCLSFLGEPDDKGIFYVAEKGVLSLYGVSVESGQYALWQEEGAGLEVSHCSISGNIHYADTPFVMYYNESLCAVVEKGLVLSDTLPFSVSCTVNRQGQLSHDERIPVSWNLEGTERQQEERRRFVLQGSFVQAASAEPILCAVAYNDYPLTFTDVEATVSGDRYTFQGGFTAPGEALPFQVMTEYSFDGENWFQYEEQTASDVDAGFRIDCKREQRSRAACANIYIRLQWNDNGTRYFSNVLCYSADDLKNMEDIGGSRGGGTSIINPPDEPQPSSDDITAASEGPDHEVNGDADSENAPSGISSNENHSDNVKPRDLSDESSAENTPSGISGNSGQTKAGGELSKTESTNAGMVQAASAESQDINTAQEASAEEQKADAAPLETTVEEQRADAAPLETTVEEKRADAALLEINAGEQRIKKEIFPILAAVGFVLLSAAAGTVGFCVHLRSGINR